MEFKKAQSGIEFILILSALLFFVTLFLLAIQGNMQDKISRRENLRVSEIALTVQNEIDLALQSMDGYTRNFEIPKKAGNLDYEINIISGVVYINAGEGKHAMTLPVAEVVGNINISENTIKKIEGIIFLNP